MASTFLLAATRRHLSELGVELGIKVNLHTPRCICEGNVSCDWYGETRFRFVQERLRQYGRGWR